MKNVFLFLALILFAACNDSKTDNTNTSKNSTTNENVEASIKKETSTFQEEFGKGDSAALAAHYGSGALIMPPNSEPIKGNDILNFWGGAIRMGVKELKLDVTDVTGNGEMAAETGIYEMIGPDGKSLDKGKYVVVWKKEGDSWKIYRDIFSSNLPVPATK